MEPVPIDKRELHIRRYQPADQEEVLKLHVQELQHVGAYLGEGSWDNDVRAIEEAYLRNGGEFLEGEIDGRLVAMGAFRKITDERAEIKRMRIAREFQGRGFGQRILDELERRAHAAGYHVLFLDTSVVQIAAQKLYLKNGYRETHREIHGWLECIYFEKWID